MKQIEDIIKKIEEDKNPPRDKTVLIMAVKLIYYCAVKPGDLINLKMKDVQDNDGEIVNDIIIKEKNKRIELNKDIRSLLQSYIDYLKGKGYGISPNSPLIPQKGKSKYRYKKLSRHLGKYIEGKKLEKSRQAGIRDYYNTNNNFSEFDEDEKLKKTAKHAQCSVRHVKGILEGKIQPAGKSKENKYYETLSRNWDLVECTDDIKKIKEYNLTVSKILKDRCLKSKSTKKLGELLLSRIKERKEELKTRVPEPVKESKGIIGHTDINFLDLLKDDIDNTGQD